jgi:alanyl-tRNA synthetase
VTSDQIRQTFLDFFQQRDHRRLPSGSLVPAQYDPSVLLTTAGMHPLKPYFLGQERPPHHRLTTAQKCFRTPDIDKVGITTRHLTFFEMLGNFSVGDYFKQGAVELAWELSLQGFGFPAEKVWITVFEGDDELGLGPDEEAIEAWLSVGVPRERIVQCPREENFWQAGPIGPCGPCSELYYDRGLAFGSADDLPGGENERFIEYWNLVFMQFNQDPENVLTPLPAKNIDTGLGLNRMAALLQGVDSVFETDQFRPLVELGEQLSGKRYGEGEESDRSLRILADHTRGMTFLVADGVVPSNEDRGYVLRRVMRRAIQHGRRLGMEPGFLTRYADVVTETMGGEYGELVRERDAIRRWLQSEEEGFGRTLEQGTRLLDDLIARARDQGAEGIASEDAFRLHDTYGFPIDLTLELVAEHGLGVDEEGFEALMEEQRTRARASATGSRPGGGALRDRALAFAQGAGFESEFVGYATTEQHTTVGAVEHGDDGRVLVKLAESPFYAAGGGQVADTGIIACEEGDCRGVVGDVVRLGDDQAVVVDVELGELRPGERVLAQVDPLARHATECNHTATHLLHAALRERLGTHVRQAGSYVGPGKLRFDFTHGAGLSSDELRDVEDRVNRQIAAAEVVRPFETTLDEARRLGAMALFGEKYGDVVRVVQIGDGGFSRELCGGTHVASTAEIGVFVVTAETSSAANVRRIEAVTGPEAVKLLRRERDELHRVAAALRKRPEEAHDAVVRLAEQAKAKAKAAPAARASVEAEPEQLDGALVLVDTVEGVDPKALRDLADQTRGRLGEQSVVVLGTAAEGRVSLVATVSPALIERGVKAGAIVREAAQAAGGGGGGKDTMAQAGGRDPEKLPEALATARRAIASALGVAPA